MRIKADINEAILMVEIVHGKSLMGYSGDEDQKFLKIMVALPQLVSTSRRMVETTNVYDKLQNYSVSFYEADIDIDLR